jgi:hypothetical protein
VLDFQDAINGQSYGVTISLQNISTTVPANSIVAVSNLSAPFSYAGGSYPGTGGTCPETLNPAVVCTIELRLDPVTAGSFTSGIQINYYDGLADQTLSIDLSATSRDPFPANLTLSPTGLHDFGVIAIGGFSDLLMTVQNSGERDATGIDLSSVVAPYSVENDTCGTTLLAGSQCTFVVRFTPVAQVVSPLTFNLDYFDGVAPQSVSKSVSW